MYKHWGGAKALFCLVGHQVKGSAGWGQDDANFSFGRVMPQWSPTDRCLIQEPHTNTREQYTTFEYGI